MEPPSPIQALGVNPFPSRFIIRTVPRGDGLLINFIIQEKHKHKNTVCIVLLFKASSLRERVETAKPYLAKYCRLEPH